MTNLSVVLVEPKEKLVVVADKGEDSEVNRARHKVTKNQELATQR